ncbi:hypothetical protein K438DRAFT_1771418 [Mycena galopus ATCC 62051]|nr:hypothetical protein K438DRAFT_1771418 [Mycena galopus ATCC 62051]
MMGMRHELLGTSARREWLNLNHTTLVHDLGLVIVIVLAAWAALTHMALIEGMDWAATSGARGRQGRSVGSEGTSFLRHRGRSGSAASQKAKRRAVPRRRFGVSGAKPNGVLKLASSRKWQKQDGTGGGGCGAAVASWVRIVGAREPVRVGQGIGHGCQRGETMRWRMRTKSQSVGVKGATKGSTERGGQRVSSELWHGWERAWWTGIAREEMEGGRYVIAADANFRPAEPKREGLPKKAQVPLNLYATAHLPCLPMNAFDVSMAALRCRVRLPITPPRATFTFSLEPPTWKAMRHDPGPNRKRWHSCCLDAATDQSVMRNIRGCPCTRHRAIQDPSRPAASTALAASASSAWSPRLSTSSLRRMRIFVKWWAMLWMSRFVGSSGHRSQNDGATKKFEKRMMRAKWENASDHLDDEADSAVHQTPKTQTHLNPGEYALVHRRRVVSTPDVHSPATALTKLIKSVDPTSYSFLSHKLPVCPDLFPKAEWLELYLRRFGATSRHKYNMSPPQLDRESRIYLKTLGSIFSLGKGTRFLPLIQVQRIPWVLNREFTEKRAVDLSMVIIFA